MGKFNSTFAVARIRLPISTQTVIDPKLDVRLGEDKSGLGNIISAMVADSLIWAAKRGDLVALEAAIRSGANVNGQDSQGWTALFMQLITAIRRHCNC